ncbi:B2 bradykinin receptor-like isoform X1 [Oreochromis aureus]|uniref:B2 bradykinin receptor-like isoform X1 n=1 Tax=Oreochromis aureus TaxID=47969 RepID=UPI001954CB6E|nr:B2 bradykinin receptor-like isoform X1 [Oreochromis aureus]XP_039458885.1 B2 bradykinin receptor-like isoform X1 [Oreochromis aureus]
MSGNQSNTSEYHCHNIILGSNNLILTIAPAYVASVLGFILNVFVLMVFCLHKKACTVTEIYLSNLTGTHLLLVCGLPFYTDTERAHYDWPFGESLCKLVPVVMRMNEFCNIYFLVLASLDCYVALVHPLFHELMSRPFNAKLGCLFVWSLGLVFAFPNFIYNKLIFNSQSNLTHCFPALTSLDQYVLYDVRVIIFNFIIPVIIILFCAVRIIQTLRKRRMEGLNPQRTEQKTTTLILAVLLAFLICWVPFHVTKLLQVLQYTHILKCNIIVLIIEELSVYLTFFSCVLNPILYVIIGKSFRNRTKEFFKQ